MKRKLYNTRWSEEETFVLIDARAAHDSEFKKKTGQFNVIWKAIQSSRIELKDRTVQECIKKWNNLMDTYKKYKDPKTGTAPTTTNASNWIYFPKMNDLMATKHNIRPPYVIESSCPTPDHDEESSMIDDMVDYAPLEVDETEIPHETQSSMIASCSNEPSTSGSSQKKIKDKIFEHIKERDDKIIKSINKNNKIIKSVCRKYFPEVDISSDSD